MKRISFLVISLCFVGLGMAQTAQETVEHFLHKLEHETLISRFTASQSDNRGGIPTTYKGFIELRGDIFHVRIFDMEIAYDGVTLATYNDDSNEITLTYPSPEELQTVNPFIVAKDMMDICTFDFAPTQPTGDVVVNMTPRVNNGIEQITIQLRKYDVLPISISLRETNRTVTTILLDQQQWSAQPPITTIPTDHEGQAEPYINDLR